MSECGVCGQDAEINLSLPMYMGKVVNPEETDEWAGAPACQSCFDKHSSSLQSQNPVMCLAFTLATMINILDRYC